VNARGPVVTKKGVAFGKGSNKNGPENEEPEELGALGYGAIAAGLFAQPITLWSAYSLKVR